MADVRCADCGFLTVREYATRELAEVDELMRATWDIPGTLDNPNVPRFAVTPLCYVMAFDLGAEAAPNTVRLALPVIQKARECKKFVPIKRGYTPKEYDDMLLNEHYREQLRQQGRQNLWLGGLIALMNAALIAGLTYYLNTQKPPQIQPIVIQMPDKEPAPRPQ